VEDLTAWYEEQLSNELKTGAPGVTLEEMKALPGAVWVDAKKLTAYEKYAAALKSKLVLDADGSVWDKPADDPKRKQLAIVVGGVLFDKPEHRLIDLPLKYVGFQLPDRFMVGYGLDHREKYRNLPFVGLLKPEAFRRGTKDLADPNTGHGQDFRSLREDQECRGSE